MVARPPARLRARFILRSFSQFGNAPGANDILEQAFRLAFERWKLERG
jgi:hypothetical protein